MACLKDDPLGRFRRINDLPVLPVHLSGYLVLLTAEAADVIYMGV